MRARGTLALVIGVLLIPTAVAAGELALLNRLLASSEVAIAITPSLAALDRLDDLPGDIYHPAGDPGLSGGALDIRSVGLAVVAKELGEILDDPFLARTDPSSDEPWSDRSADFKGLDDGPLFVSEIELAAPIEPSGPLFCEYLVAWNRPDGAVFQGIPGDLFNGTNSVAVLRVGAGVTDGLASAALEYHDQTWQEVEPFGAVVAEGNRVLFALPAAVFGTASDALGPSPIDSLQTPEAADTVVDFNFGAFCSEGGRSFDPAVGGVDILQAPLDLAGLPVVLLGLPAEPEPTVTAAPVTTVVSAPATTVPSTSGGGPGPAVVALVLGGLGGAVYAGWRWAQSRQEDPPRGSAPTFRVTLTGDHAATFSGASGLDIDSDPIEYRTGSERDTPRKQPGLPKHTTVTLRNGSTASQEFLDWARAAHPEGAMSGAIEMNQAGGPGIEWSFERGWPSKFEGPAFNPKLTDHPIDRLELTLEDFRLKLNP